MTGHAARRARSYDDVNKLKRCAACNEWKPFDVFAPARGQKTSKTAISLQSYCRPCSVAKSREWAQANPEAKCQHVKDSYWRDPEKYREKKNAEPHEKRAARNANHRAWRKENLQKVLMWNRVRKMRLRVAGPQPRAADIVRMFEEQDCRCAYCAATLDEGFHVDHKVPVSRGGANDLSNLQLLCAACNLKKGAKTHEEYLAWTIGQLYGGR